ncbi:MAG TPA: hypothetical protein VJ549_04455 [Geothrix sp.]|nr:hypothetical protein [Geothrix sp.]
MDVYLDTKEMDLLMGLLEHRLEDLRREIHHTDSRAFKAELKTDETILKGVLTKLKTPAAMGI